LHQLHLNTYWTNGYIGGYPPRLIEQLSCGSPPRLILEKDIGKLLAVLVTHNKAGVLLFNGPWRRETAGGHSCQLNREMDDCRCYAADQKAKCDDDDRFRDWRSH
jgi:hypothetical protein